MGLARSAARLGSDDGRVAENARAYLVESMGELRGLPQKIGQILSMGDSPEAQSFAPLTGEAKPLPFADIEAALETAWGRPWRDALKTLDPAGLAASLGQVHRGTLKSGEAVAVKVQYPGMAEAVQADLKLLGWLTAPVGGLRRGFDLPAYRDEILRDLGEELDYRREAEQQQRFAERAIPHVIVPRVYERLGTSRVLVTAWEDGAPLNTVAQNWNAAQRKSAARLFLVNALDALFRHGEVQGDLHPGNFRFRLDAGGQVQLVLFDFGCVFRPSESARLALLRLIAITRAQGDSDPFPYYLAMGFREDHLEPLARRLPALSRVLLDPFLLDGEYDPARWRLSERVSDVLGEDRWNFRVAGPATLILLMRVMHGVLHALRTLDAPVSWSAPLRPILESAAPAMASLTLPRPERPERGFGGMARHLRLQIREGGEIKVRLTSPLHVVDNLQEAMGEDIAAKVRARGIDLNGLASRVRASGYVPQEIFLLRYGAKQVRVWLE